MTYYVSDIIGDGTDAEANCFRPAIADVADTWNVVVDARADDSVTTGKMLVKAASGLSGSGFTAMRRSHLSDYGMSESGFQDDADDPDLCRQLGRRGLLRRWLANLDFPVTMSTTLGSLPGTLTQLRNRVLALQPGMTFNGLTGSSTVGQALAVVLPQITLHLESRGLGQSGTFTDNFNGAGANTNLASWTPSGGTAWTLVDGTGSWAQVSSASNRLITSNTDATGASWRCDDQASADQYVQYKWQGTSVISFICCRHVSRTSYIGIRGQAATPKVNVFRNNAGFTSLGTGTTTIVSGDTLRLECSGNNLEAFINGVSELSGISETHNNTQTRQGCHVRNDGTVGWADDYEAGTLAAGTTVARLVNGGLVHGGTLMSGRLVREAA